MRKMYANAELEGGEMLQLPDGSGGEVQGASHSQGGVDMNLPEGSKVYSDRVKIMGKTMAERKADREKRLSKIINLTDKSSILDKNTLERTKAVIDQEDKFDMTIQEIMKQNLNEGVEENMGDTPKFAGGGYIFKSANPKWSSPYYYHDPITGVWSRMDANGKGTPIPATDTKTIKQLNSSYYKDGKPVDTYMARNLETNENLAPLKGSRGLSSMLSEPTLKAGKNINTAKFDQLNPKSPSTTDTKMGMTTGDMVGLAGQTLGGILETANTIADKRDSLKNINYYLGFNDKAITANNEAMDQNNYLKDVAQIGLNRKLMTSENNARARNAGSATSLNTLNALNLSTDMGVDESMVNANNQLESTFGGQRVNLINNKIGLLSQKDQMEMAGEERKANATQQDIDNYYSNMGENIASMTTGLQSAGAAINATKERNDFLKILPDTNKWGIGMDSDFNLTSMGGKTVPVKGQNIGVTPAPVSNIEAPFYDDSYMTRRRY